MIVLVVGMHRSGTSALAGMLHSNGIIMGEEHSFRPKPMRENPKGFYENHEFRVINDQILRGHGYAVKSFNPDVPKIDQLPPSAHSQMVARIEQYRNVYEWWGWKDPRTCLTLPMWLKVMTDMGIKKEEVRVLIPSRAPAEVADSMKARGNREKQEGQFEALARTYHERAMEAMGPHIRFKLIEFHRLLNNTKAVTRELEAFLGCAIPDTSFIEPAIAKQVK
jgi:hypothetical protein